MREKALIVKYRFRSSLPSNWELKIVVVGQHHAPAALTP
jgi:hypothetical protein